MDNQPANEVISGLQAWYRDSQKHREEKDSISSHKKTKK